MLLYNIGIYIYNFAIHIAALFNIKAKAFVTGRKNNPYQTLQSFKNDKLIWVHCASLGEFEQGRPLIEHLKKKYSQHKILLTFFSPSGYETRKNYAVADIVCYLPIDTPSQVKKFISHFNPSIAFFIKYEFWLNYISELKRRNIPLFLISGIFRKDQVFFKWYGSVFRKRLQWFSHLFLQNSESKTLLETIGISNTTISGDTRFDRVIEIAESNNEIKQIQKFKNDSCLLIAGSTWEEDVKLLKHLQQIHAFKENWKILIAPHRTDNQSIIEIKNLFRTEETVLFSKYDSDKTSPSAKIMILDTIGLLSTSYKYATAAYIGGGFGKGIHNITEAAVYGIPTVFGPNHNRFREAVDLIKLKGSYKIKDANELLDVFRKFTEVNNFVKDAGIVSKNYIYSNRGALQKITEHIVPIL